MKVESSFIQGSPTQKPLKFYSTVFFDILYCFDVFLLHLKSYGELICVKDSETLNVYKGALYLNDNFIEYVNNVINSFNCKGSIGL